MPYRKGNGDEWTGEQADGQTAGRAGRQWARVKFCHKDKMTRPRILYMSSGPSSRALGRDPTTSQPSQSRHEELQDRNETQREQKEAIAGSKNPIAARHLSTRTSSRTLRIRNATGNRIALTVTQPPREAPPLHGHVHATCCLNRIEDSQRATLPAVACMPGAYPSLLPNLRLQLLTLGCLLTHCESS